MHLIVDTSGLESESKEATTDMISEAFSGYAPLSIRIIEGILADASDSARKLSGSQTTFLSQWPDGTEQSKIHLLTEKGKIQVGTSKQTALTPAASTRDNASSIVSENNQLPTTVLVFFVGGCTVAEVSALRILGASTKTKFIIATTGIINGQRMMECLAAK